MLVLREGEGLEVEDISAAEQAIEPGAECVCGQFRVEARGQSPEAVGMVSFDVKLEGQLAVDGLDELAQMRVQVAKRR